LRRLRGICNFLTREYDVKAVVIACNTATAAGIELLRASLSYMPARDRVSALPIIVGVEPAVKPAVEGLKRGRALVLLTPAAARQDKFLRLIKQYEAKTAIAVMPNLAALIECSIDNLDKIKNDVCKMLAPYKDDNIESVVLGCTHYCFVDNIIKDFFKAKTYDGNTGTAARLCSLLTQNNLLSGKGGGTVEFIAL